MQLGLGSRLRVRVRVKICCHVHCSRIVRESLGLNDCCYMFCIFVLIYNLRNVFLVIIKFLELDQIFIISLFFKFPVHTIQYTVYIEDIHIPFFV